MGNKNTKHCDKLKRDLVKQGCRIKEKRNNILLLPPLGVDAPPYTWHPSDKHIGPVVDFVKKHYASALDFSKLSHRRFKE